MCEFLQQKKIFGTKLRFDTDRAVHILHGSALARAQRGST